ncbi:hypothetical protein KFL_003350160 [Klebsormidium nitens]|uniref:Uncharacterized protein n=1 Tax=Klebsormidium nitens TaxID=105231 RepID=A0A0U9HKE6_KLENI|nr:hypothetical protein KFL_003350160 [Klebsormidium nitens]|eukprot:GAQ87166.1 hypothetical protein KFL_003350160 [Klebsormidium nitens]
MDLVLLERSIVYIRNIKQVIAKVEEVGFIGPKIFRATTASWHRFGNHHAHWQAVLEEEQSFVTSRYTVAVFNKHVIPIFKAAGWSIVDAYTSTTARPDATQSSPKQNKAAMVHFEPDVAHLHNRQMLGLTLLQRCPNVLKRECSLLVQ